MITILVCFVAIGIKIIMVPLRDPGINRINKIT